MAVLAKSLKDSEASSLRVLWSHFAEDYFPLSCVSKRLEYPAASVPLERLPVVFPRKPSTHRDCGNRNWTRWRIYGAPASVQRMVLGAGASDRESFISLTNLQITARVSSFTGSPLHLHLSLPDQECRVGVGLRAVAVARVGDTLQPLAALRIFECGND